MDEQDMEMESSNEMDTSWIKNESDTGAMDNIQRLLGEMAVEKADVNSYNVGFLNV